MGTAQKAVAARPAGGEAGTRQAEQRLQGSGNLCDRRTESTPPREAQCVLETPWHCCVSRVIGATAWPPWGWLLTTGRLCGVGQAMQR